MAKTDLREGTTSFNNEEGKNSLPPSPPAGWDRCHAYMEQKRRFCKQHPVAGTKFCGNHTAKRNERKRIPCPIDPSHTIFEDQVLKHRWICPKWMQQQRLVEKPYFRRDVNVGGHGDDNGSTVCTVCTSTEQQDQNKALWAKRVAIAAMQVFQQISDIDTSEVDPAKWPLDSIENAMGLEDFSVQEFPHLTAAVEHFMIKSGGPRHVLQQASLIGWLRKLHALPPFVDEGQNPQQLTARYEDDLVLIEMGAGRGMTGLVAAGVANKEGGSNVHLVMVERSGSRAKADTVLLRTQTQAESLKPHPYMSFRDLSWTRIPCDLAHVHMPTVLAQLKTRSDDKGGKDHGNRPTKGEKRQKIAGLNQTKVVVIAKHLCGAGTDLALKSLRDIKVDTCVMATCCHGVCNWADYVGRNELKQLFEPILGMLFGPNEFELLRRWSSGTTLTCQKCKGPTDSKDDRSDANEGASVEDEHATFNNTMSKEGSDPLSVHSVAETMEAGVQGLGRACQRIIDHGRLRYLHDEVMEGSRDATKGCMKNYVPSRVTPQNAVIACWTE